MVDWRFVKEGSSVLLSPLSEESVDSAMLEGTVESVSRVVDSRFAETLGGGGGCTLEPLTFFWLWFVETLGGGGGGTESEVEDLTVCGLLATGSVSSSLL